MDILAKIGFDWQVALANFVNFLIILWILNRFVFKPLSATIEERKRKIKEGVEKFEKAGTLLAEAERKKEEIIRASKKEANEILAKAKTGADEIIARAKSDAEKEAVAIIENAQKRAVAIEEETIANIKKRTANLITSAVEKIIQGRSDAKLDAKIAEDVIAIVESEKV